MSIKFTDEIEMSDYFSMRDEEIATIAQEGNLDALELLIKRYISFVRLRAASYFLAGGDREDVVQEGMIGLYQSIKDYDRDDLASFKRFADLCITRQMITAIKGAARQKHVPLNIYVSLNEPVYTEDSNRTLQDVLSCAKITDPEELMLSSEGIYYIENTVIQVLSDLEWEVLVAHLDGKSYSEISIEINRPIKSVDNAIQRARRKLEVRMELE